MIRQSDEGRDASYDLGSLDTQFTPTYAVLESFLLYLRSLRSFAAIKYLLLS